MSPALPCLRRAAEAERLAMSIDAGALDTPVGPHEDEPHEDSFSSRLNWLRAGVLGANDGIVSTAGS